MAVTRQEDRTSPWRKERLKADWLIEWMKKPQAFQPGTAMPQAWPLVGGQHMPIEGYAGDDAEKQIRARSRLSHFVGKMMITKKLHQKPPTRGYSAMTKI